MGIYNSSIYRVRPLMDALKSSDKIFRNVLELVGVEGLSSPKSYWYDGLDCCEKQLKPSKQHLLKLIDYISKKDFGNTVIKNEYRRQLCCPDETNSNRRNDMRNMAIDALEKNYDSMSTTCKEWFVFEGFTCPDIFIEGKDYVIVCEGKWTENHITTETVNLKSKDGEYRNQMIRHIQGALNYADKKIYAFYIVDKNCGYLNQLTKEAFSKQLNAETIALDDLEKEKIEDAFKGYTTWQDIEEIVPDIEFKSKEEIRKNNNVF